MGPVTILFEEGRKPIENSLRCQTLTCILTAEFEVEAATVGELKEQVEETIGVDVEDWRLFQFGFLLPADPETG